MGVDQRNYRLAPGLPPGRFCRSRVAIPFPRQHSKGLHLPTGKSTSGLLTMGRPLSSEHGTHKTVKARFWPWLSGTSPQNIFEFFPICSEAARSTQTELSFPGVVRLGLAVLSDTMYLLISFRKSTPPQNRLLNISSSHSRQ